MGRKLRSPLPQAKSQFKHNGRTGEHSEEKMNSWKWHKHWTLTGDTEQLWGLSWSQDKQYGSLKGALKANMPRSNIVQTGTDQRRRNKAHLHPQPEHSVQAPETPGAQRETTMVQQEPLVEMPETVGHRREAEVEQVPETTRTESTYWKRQSAFKKTSEATKVA